MMKSSTLLVLLVTGAVIIFSAYLIVSKTRPGDSITLDQIVKDIQLEDHVVEDKQAQREAKVGEPDGPEVLDCKDNKDNCPIWADEGECQANPAFMRAECRLSCNLCTPGEIACVDKSDNCLDWSLRGECEENPSFMLESCRKSCNAC